MKLRVLFLAAQPRGSTKLALEEEARRIQQGLDEAGLSSSVELVPEWVTKPGQVLAIVNRDDHWRVIHFSGHGTEDGELLLDDDEHAYPVAPQVLAEFFEHNARRTRLVVLNACYSAVQAEQITQHVDCAVGMSRAIGDRSAIEFSVALYRALAAGRTVQDAVSQGRSAIGLDLSPDGDAVALCKRDDDSGRTVVAPAPASFRADDEWTRCTPAPAARRPQDRWHVYLRGFEDNHEWTVGLHDVLVHHGYTVFMDQLAAVPDEPRDARLATARATSQQGILVWSSRGKDLEESHAELAKLRDRQRQGDGFDFVVAARGDAPPEVEGASIRFPLDGRGPNGAALVDLLFTLRGLPRSAEADRLVQELDASAREARERIRGLVRAGGERSAKQLCQLFRDGWDTPAWRASVELGCSVAESLVRLGESVDGNDRALELLDEVASRFPRSLRQKQLRAHALSRRGGPGDADEARALLGSLVEDHRDPETLGMYARTWMDRYTETEIRRYLVQSRDLYLDGFERAPDDTYCGINAASKTAMLGDLPQARRLARLVHERLAATEPRDYYERATVAEASVLLGEYARAAAEYRHAAYLDVEQRGSIGTTWLQLQRLRKHLPMSPEAWTSLAAVFEELGFEEGPEA